MDAGELPASTAQARFEPPYELRLGERPAGVAPSPLVFASPHSGRHYPPDMGASARLGETAIRSSEDVLVDKLIEAAPRHGCAVLLARYARAYVDVNREPYELDAAMFEDEVPEFARGRTARVAAGLGSIARLVAEGREIYDRKLTFAEAMARIETVHKPYHLALRRLLDEAVSANGAAVLIDWHSMPGAASRGGAGRRQLDMVLGDRFGSTCSPVLTDTVEQALVGMGYVVARNAPYAGGFTTESYGRPVEGVHALQIEISRSLYLDEGSLCPKPSFQGLAQNLERVFETLAALDPRALR